MYETWLRSFHAVARHDGFTAAARSLNLSQPTITEQVKSLEDKFGVELFHRRGRTIRLTETGLSLYEITTGFTGHAEEALRYLNSVAEAPAGRFNIGSVTPYHVMETIKSFREHYAEVETTLNVDHRRQIIQSLYDFQIDIALIGRYEPDPRILNHKYKTLEVQVLLPNNHYLIHKEQLKMRDFAGEKWVLREERSTTRRAFEAAAHKSGLEITSAMQVNSREAIREGVRMGVGLGLTTTGETFDSEELCKRSITDVDLQIEFHIACLKSRGRRPLISAFIDIATQSI